MVGLKGGIAVCPFGMRVKDLKGWLQEAKREKDPEGRRWYPVVRLVQVMFRDSPALEYIDWSTMVLLSKGKGGYRVIGIVEMLCRVFSVVVNFSLKMSVMMHNNFYGFR